MIWTDFFDLSDSDANPAVRNHKLVRTDRIMLLPGAGSRVPGADGTVNAWNMRTPRCP